jgi:hypothetical protein
VRIRAGVLRAVLWGWDFLAESRQACNRAGAHTNATTKFEERRSAELALASFLHEGIGNAGRGARRFWAVE